MYNVYTYEHNSYVHRYGMYTTQTDRYSYPDLNTKSDCSIRAIEQSSVHTRQCWASYFLKVTSYILLATELFSYSSYYS